MGRKLCLFGLIAITAVVGVPALYCFVAGTCATIDDMFRTPPPNTYPTLPNLAPAFALGSLVVLVPLGGLWCAYLAFTRRSDQHK